jgi:hypothetical protein
MKKPRFYSPRLASIGFAAACLAVPIASAWAQSHVLLPEGNFEQADAAGKPAGWQLNSPTNISLGGDAANRWVQMRDGGMLEKTIKLDPSWKKIVISTRMRMSNYVKGPEGWQRPHIALRFLDEAGQVYGDYVATPEVSGNTDWTIRRVAFDIPEGAKQLRLQPGLWGTKGLFEIDDIVVKAYAAGATIDPEVAADAPWPSASKHAGAAKGCRCKAPGARASVSTARGDSPGAKQQHAGQHGS